MPAALSRDVSGSRILSRFTEVSFRKLPIISITLSGRRSSPVRVAPEDRRISKTVSTNARRSSGDSSEIQVFIVRSTRQLPSVISFSRMKSPSRIS